ncbi:hypothetical protein ASG90_19930 [Nocardioides sp. Soil797]|nr:hypothetical protein ASG90_19930 [Nocardioides sp. Soil797]
MKLILAALLLVPSALVTTPSTAAPTSAAQVTAAPAHSLTVTGAGVATYPAFKPSIERYGITTTAASNGTVKVTAGTGERNGTIRIDGRPAPTGQRTVRGLAAGDEISVIIEDSSGTSAYSLIYLPTDLHAVTASGSQPAPQELTLLTLGLWGGGTPFYEVAVDANGVPATVHEEATSAMDFKRQPNGELSVSRGSATSPGKTGSAVVTLGDDLSPTGSHETQGLKNTDGHDSILMEDGTRYFVSYEPNAESGLTDAVIQQVDADGNKLFEWNTSDHVTPRDESVIEETNPDYAHINSIQIMDDGDILASFRHFSAVFKIARTPRAGFAEGDIVWKLGGHDSSFEFDEGEGGPCAQHTASQLDDGHILIFDNGSWTFGGAHPLCINPADRAGDTIPRPTTRITEYAIDETTMEASLVWEYTHVGQFAIFAGSAERLPNGNTLVGWASSRDAVVSEINPDKEVVWELKDPTADLNSRQFTYRADRTTIPDATDPTVELPVTDGAAYDGNEVVRPAYTCTDRGGSSLQSCVTTGMQGDRLDTSTPGEHTVSVTATDGAGNTATVTRHYSVGELHRPDATIRKQGSKKFVGDGIHGRAKPGQIVTYDLRRARNTQVVQVRIGNDGNVAERFWLAGAKGSAKFRMKYVANGTNVTRKVVAGTFRTPTIRPGKHWTMTVRVTRTAKARKGDARKFNLQATSPAHRPKDAVALRVRAR